MKVKQQIGLFADVRETVDRTLGVENYTTKTAALALSKRGLTSGSEPLVGDLFEVLNRNWKSALPTAAPSSQNFRWHYPQTCISQRNRSAEASLERALIGALLQIGRQDWSNQVPLISGIAGSHAFKRRAVDLVHHRGERSFEFVELKIDADSPLFAAVEILVYGLLWLLSARDLRYGGPIVQARELGLSVLAPQAYYHRYSLKTIASAINDGLQALGEQHKVHMQFRFTAFPDEFAWTCDSSRRPSDSDLIRLLDARRAI
jgi:hypothetical protein